MCACVCVCGGGGGVPTCCGVPRVAVPVVGHFLSADVHNVIWKGSLLRLLLVVHDEHCDRCGTVAPLQLVDRVSATV
jgi:hypothetical protein